MRSQIEKMAAAANPLAVKVESPPSAKRKAFTEDEDEEETEMGELYKRRRRNVKPEGPTEFKHIKVGDISLCCMERKEYGTLIMANHVFQLIGIKGNNVQARIKSAKMHEAEVRELYKSDSGQFARWLTVDEAVNVISVFGPLYKPAELIKSLRAAIASSSTDSKEAHVNSSSSSASSATAAAALPTSASRPDVETSITYLHTPIGRIKIVYQQYKGSTSIPAVALPSFAP